MMMMLYFGWNSFAGGGGIDIRSGVLGIELPEGGRGAGPGEEPRLPAAASLCHKQSEGRSSMPLVYNSCRGKETNISLSYVVSPPGFECLYLF
jgi:hypothetical protein